MKKLIVTFCIFSFLLSAGYSAETNRILPKKVAFFVANRGGSQLNDQMPLFEDMITAQITDLGFEVISQEIVVNVVGDLPEKLKKNELDSLLDDQISALRLSQNLGADYILFASLMGMDKEQHFVNAYGVRYKNETYTLRASYRILDGNTGESLIAGMMEPNRTIQQTKHSTINTTGVIHELLAKASRELASDLEQKNYQKRIREIGISKNQVELQIEINLNNVNFPQAEIDKKGYVTIVANQATVEPLAVTVELDGFVIGSTGNNHSNTFTVAPGLHRIRLTRDDLVPYERMINIQEGTRLNIAMRLNDEGLRRWNEKTTVFNDLIQKTKLNNAEVNVLYGEAEMLRQSGYKVNVTIDTDEAVIIKNNKSLINQN